MKKILFIITFLLCGLDLGAKEPDPPVKVCVPKVDLNYLEFQFQIRPARPPCSPNEKELEVKKGENGALLFVPPEPPASTSPADPSRS